MQNKQHNSSHITNFFIKINKTWL